MFEIELHTGIKINLILNNLNAWYAIKPNQTVRKMKNNLSDIVFKYNKIKTYLLIVISGPTDYKKSKNIIK